MKKTTEEKGFCIMITIVMCLNILMYLLFSVICVLILVGILLAVMLALVLIQMVAAIMIIKNPKQLMASYKFGFTERAENFTEGEWMEIQKLLDELEKIEEREQRKKRIDKRKRDKD